MDPRGVSPGSGGDGRGRGSGRDSGRGGRGRGSGRDSSSVGRGTDSVGRSRGSSGGRGTDSGGRSRGSSGSGDLLVDTSGRRLRRVSDQYSMTGTRLMPAFDAAAGGVDGGGSEPSSGGLDLGPDGSPIHRGRGRGHRVNPEASPTSNLGRLLSLGSTVGLPTQDDEVIVMDGVLVGDGSVTGPRRSSSSFADPGSDGSGGYGSNSKFSHRGEEPRAVRSMNQRFSEVELQDGRPTQSPGSSTSMQGNSRGYSSLPPSQPGDGTPRGAANFPVWHPAPPFFRPPRFGTVPARLPGPPFFVPQMANPTTPSVITPGFGASRYPGEKLPPQQQFRPTGFTLSPSQSIATNIPARRPGYSTSNELEARPLPLLSPVLLPPELLPPRPPLPALQPQRPPPPGFPPTLQPHQPPPPVPAPAPHAQRPPLAAPAPREAYTWPPTEEDDAEITNVLYGPRKGNRLPVFKSICPD